MSPERDPQAWGTMVLAVVLAAACGCTICPDPFDYSGPVPNGSPPQNDFRARSNGILPLGAAPTPWPLIVEGRNAIERGIPTLAEDVDGGVLVDETSAAVEPVSILVTAGVEADEATSEAGAGADPDLAADGGRGDPWRVIPSFEPEAGEAVELLETPGWRPRSVP